MNCKHLKTKVTESRKYNSDRDCEKLRYRQCIECGEQIRTIEVRIPTNGLLNSLVQKIRRYALIPH